MRARAAATFTAASLFSRSNQAAYGLRPSASKYSRISTMLYGNTYGTTLQGSGCISAFTAVAPQDRARHAENSRRTPCHYRRRSLAGSGKADSNRRKNERLVLWHEPLMAMMELVPRDLCVFADVGLFRFLFARPRCFGLRRRFLLRRSLMLLWRRLMLLR